MFLTLPLSTLTRLKFQPSKRNHASRSSARKKNTSDTTHVDGPSGEDACYPTFANVDPAVLQGLSPVNIVDRAKKLPQLYTFEGAHPSHRVKTSSSRTFVYLLDSSPQGKALAHTLSESMDVPGGPVSGKCTYCLSLKYLSSYTVRRVARSFRTTTW